MATQWFEACSTIWHTKDKRHYAPGERFSLDHLSADAVSLLERGGHVKRVEGPFGGSEAIVPGGEG